LLWFFRGGIFAIEVLDGFKPAGAVSPEVSGGPLELFSFSCCAVACCLFAGGREERL